MGLLSLRKASLQSLRPEMEQILSLACEDNSEWVKTIATLLLHFPEQQFLSRSSLCLDTLVEQLKEEFSATRPKDAGDGMLLPPMLPAV